MATSTEHKRQGLLKISDLARETGVATGTIKFYIREGLLPPPTLKTGRNMAYYDRSFVDRLRLIKELQQKRYLPLDVIKAILDQNDSVISAHEIETLLNLEGTFYEAIHCAPGKPMLTRAEVLKRYNTTNEDIRLCIDLGVLSPIERNGTTYFEGDDILLFESFLAMEKLGLSKDVIPHKASMPIYVRALDELAREELKMFTQAVTGNFDTAKIAEMAIASVKVAEQMMVLLRRKLLLNAIQELRLERVESEYESEPPADSASGTSAFEAQDIGVRSGTEGL